MMEIFVDLSVRYTCNTIYVWHIEEHFFNRKWKYFEFLSPMTWKWLMSRIFHQFVKTTDYLKWTIYCKMSCYYCTFLGRDRFQYLLTVVFTGNSRLSPFLNLCIPTMVFTGNSRLSPFLNLHMILTILVCFRRLKKTVHMACVLEG